MSHMKECNKAGEQHPECFSDEITSGDQQVPVIQARLSL